MKKLYIPSDESELVFLKSVLESDEIPFYVQNENFGSLYSGAYVDYFNAKTIMVPDEYYDEAKQIIKSVIEDAVFIDTNDKGSMGLSELIENLISFVTFGLYKPDSGSNSEKSRDDKD